MSLGKGVLSIASIFALSTSIPLSEILCPRTIPLLTMKWHFFPIEHQIRFFTSLQNFIKIVETVVKGFSIDGKVVHENFYNLLTETMKYCRHTPLKSSRCITQTKRHTP